MGQKRSGGLQLCTTSNRIAEVRPEAEAQCHDERVRVFEYERNARRAWCELPVLEEIHAAQPVVRRIAGGLWADDRDPEPGRNQ